MGSKNKGKAAIIIASIAGIALIISSVKVTSILMQYKNSDKAIETVQKEAVDESDHSLDWDALNSINENIVGWIYVPGTKINHPMILGKSNSQYLQRNIYEEYDVSGSIFLDCRNDEDFDDFNTIIYGHNMHWSGAMFHDLEKFFDQDFLDNHQKFYISTENQNYEVEIFSVFLADGSDALYDDIFKNVDGRDNDEKMDYYHRLASMNQMLVNEIEINANDHIVILSTCHKDHVRRHIVCGKMVKNNGPKIEMSVD